MKKIDYDQLQDALEHIKIVCEEQGKNGCSSCPLGDKNGFCRLAICPQNWTLRHPDTDVFRVLE